MTSKKNSIFNVFKAGRFWAMFRRFLNDHVPQIDLDSINRINLDNIQFKVKTYNEPIYSSPWSGGFMYEKGSIDYPERRTINLKIALSSLRPTRKRRVNCQTFEFKH